MALTVLTDSDVKGLLATLDNPGLSRIFTSLGDAFLAYSTGNEARYQIHRQAVTRPSGTTMLFMPSTLPSGSSVKVIGAPPPSRKTSAATEETEAVAKETTTTANANSDPPKPLRGVVMVCDADGKATGVLNAEEFTAFRTALGSILAYRHRERTERVVVFGAGKQALWHLRLALVLGRGSESEGANTSTVRSVTVVNRSASRAEAMIERLREMDRESGMATTDGVEFAVVDPEEAGVGGGLREAVVRADVIFCTTPATKPVFPAEWLLEEEAKGKGEGKTRFVSAIGSYKLDMQEIDPGYLRAVIGGGVAGSYHPDGGREGEGVVMVDSREACYLEAGEIVKAEIPEGNIMEAGIVEDVLRNGDEHAKSRLGEWLRHGNVVYKSVGMGVMDLAISRALLELAMSKGVGTTVPSF